MAKLIHVDKESFESLVNEFIEKLRTTKLSNGQINFTKSTSVDRTAVVRFTVEAWSKMQLLINHFDSEVGWHGTARRSEDEEDVYIIDDILVYPQVVTGSTVTPDQAKYEQWLYSHDDDVFNNIRFQGHSHVNMPTSPSTTDLTFYDSILNQLGNQMFYIFMICNKKGDKTVMIYDMMKNVLFETSDVSVVVGDSDFSGFISEADKLVEKKSYSYGYGYQNNGNYGYNYGQNSSYKPAITKVETTTKSKKKDVRKSDDEDRYDTAHKSYQTVYDYVDDDEWGDGFWK